MWAYLVVMGDRLNFIIDHRLESVEAFDAILPIIIGSNIFTELSTFYAPEGNSGASSYYTCTCLCICPCVKDHNWFSYIILWKTYCKSSSRLSVSETSLPCGLVVHINLVTACFVQASDDRLLKMRIDHHNQQPFRLINRSFPIIGTSLISGPSNCAHIFNETKKIHCVYRWIPVNELKKRKCLSGHPSVSRQ